MRIKPKRALISVYNKKGLIELGKTLKELGIEIISTGGTARRLIEAGIDIEEVTSVTEFPEMLGGRVKSLHPKIHAGILARRDRSEDLTELSGNGIATIDLVIVNLYPFHEVVQKAEKDISAYIEMIDIGGPALLRAAAKNFKYVTVVSDPGDYGDLREELLKTGGISLQTRLNYARKAFTQTAAYDLLISSFFNNSLDMDSQGMEEQEIMVIDQKLFPEKMFLSLTKVQDLRYGENPHQKAALYRLEENIVNEERAERPSSEQEKLDLTSARQLCGKALSYNNLNDLNAAVNLVLEFNEPAVSIVKHTNPCGTAVGSDVKDAFIKALSSDPLSAFGSIVAVNRRVSREIAEVMVEKASFIEVIAAPGFSEGAVKILSERWKNIILIALSGLKNRVKAIQFKQVEGGFLLQEKDYIGRKVDTWEVVTRRKPTDRMLEDLEFAWKVAKNVKSNAIVIARDGGTVGIGAGQMSRVDACRIAVEKGRGKTENAVAASDAFFPFPDALETLAAYGVQAVIQPGGSIRDEEVIRRADELGIVMIFTGERHFLH